MVTENVEDSRHELIEPARRFPVRVATGLGDITGRQAVFELDHSQILPDDAAFTQLDAELGGLLSRQIERAKSDLGVNPTSPDLLNNMASLLLNQERSDEAVDYLSQALEQVPGRVDIRSNLVRALVGSGRIDEARSHADQILAEGHSDPLPLSVVANVLSLTGEPKRAIKVYTDLLKKFRDDFTALYNRGVQYLLISNRPRAIRDLRAAVTLRPRLAAGHNALGVAYMLEGSTKKALKYFRTAVSLGGTTEMTRNLSMTLMAAGESQQALEVLEHHLAIYQSDSETRERYAATLRDIGDREKCVKELGRLIDAAENSAPESLARLHNNLGVALAETRDYDGGIHYLELSLAIETDEVPYENLARVLLAARHLGKVRDLLEVHAASFNSSFTWSLRGRLAELEGNYDDAKDSYQKAIDTQRDKSYGYAGLGKLLIDIDLAPHRAIEVLSEGLKSCPTNLAIANNLAYARLMAGDTHIARQILERLADESDPYFLTATRGLLLIREGHVEEGSRLYNLASREAIDKPTRLLVEQKKWIEIARYWLENKNSNRARKALASAMKIQVEEQLFGRQLEALVAAAAAA